VSGESKRKSAMGVTIDRSLLGRPAVRTSFCSAPRLVEQEEDQGRSAEAGYSVRERVLYSGIREGGWEPLVIQWSTQGDAVRSRDRRQTLCATTKSSVWCCEAYCRMAEFQQNCFNELSHR